MVQHPRDGGHVSINSLLHVLLVTVNQLHGLMKHTGLEQGSGFAMFVLSPK